MTNIEQGNMRIWLLQFMFVQYPMFQIEETGDFYDGIPDPVWESYGNLYRQEYFRREGPT